MAKVSLLYQKTWIEANCFSLIRFYKKTKRNAIETLKNCKAPIFKAYLVWRLEHSWVKKESTAITYWKVLSMWYAQETHEYMNEGVLYDIRNVRSLPLLSKPLHDDFYSSQYLVTRLKLASSCPLAGSVRTHRAPCRDRCCRSPQELREAASGLPKHRQVILSQSAMIAPNDPLPFSFARRARNVSSLA